MINSPFVQDDSKFAKLKEVCQDTEFSSSFVAINKMSSKEVERILLDGYILFRLYPSMRTWYKDAVQKFLKLQYLETFGVEKKDRFYLFAWVHFNRLLIDYAKRNYSTGLL